MVIALFQLPNTPDKDCGLSAAEVLFGCGMKNSLPHLNKSVKFKDPSLMKVEKERAIRSKIL